MVIFSTFAEYHAAVIHHMKDQTMPYFVFTRKRYLAVLFILLPFFLNAQQNKVDSLMSLLEDSDRDTSRVNTLIELTRQLYWTARYDDALSYAAEALELSQQLKFPRGEGDARIAAGHTLLRKGAYDSALRHFNSARMIFYSIHQYQSLANSYLFTGQAYDYLAQYNEALYHYRIALNIIKDHPDEGMMIKILNSTGVTYFNKGSYETALDYYLQSLKISANFPNRLFYASTLNNIGVVHMSIHQYDDALKYFLMYLGTVKELGHRQSTAVALLNVGEAHMSLRNYEKSVPYLDSALNIYTEISDKRGVSLTNSNLGSSYHNLHNYAAAEKHYAEAIRIAQDIKSDEALLKALIGITELYIATGNTTRATGHLDQAVTISKRTGAVLWQEKAFLFRSRLDSARNNFKDAYAWFKKYSALNDSLFNERKSQQVVQMRELYESEKKDKEILLLSEAKKVEEMKVSGNQKLLLVSVIFFVLIIAAILYWGNIKSRHSKILEEQNKKISDAYEELKVLMDKVEDQNKMLASKNEALEDLHREKDGLIGIVAHDLRSPLNRITGLTQILSLNNNLNHEEKEIVGIIQKVCKDGNGLIRDLLDIHQYENSEKLTITQLKLTEFISGLLNHYTPHVDKKDLKMFFEYETEACIATDAGYLNRILDNIITNAIKFSPTGRNIYVKMLTGENTVKLIIQDEGPGFHPDDIPYLFRKFKKLSARPTGGESSTGLGLSIVKSLVEKIKGTIALESNWGKGAAFVIELPVEIGVREVV